MVSVQILVIALWVFLVGRSLARVLRHARRRAAQRGGTMRTADLRGALAELLTEPAFIGDRRALGAATIALVAALLLFGGPR